MPSQRAVFIRAMILVVAAVATGIGLRLLSGREPAFTSLITPLYWIISAGFIVAIWRTTRHRSAHDRRAAVRRHDTPGE